MDRLTREHIKVVEKQYRDRLERQIKLLADRLSECAGYIASVRTDRKIKDQYGDVYAAQTVAWAEGAKDIAERANAVLEQYDAGTLGND